MCPDMDLLKKLIIFNIIYAPTWSIYIFIKASKLYNVLPAGHWA